MKRFSLLWSFLCLVLVVQAQVPVDYYRPARGKHGAALKTALFDVVREHVQRTYKQLWEDFKTTDVRADGKIWDMYSAITNYEPGGPDQGALYSVEGTGYNREHSFPKSWFAEGYPMYTDLFHLYPTDGYVNGRHSNYPFGETAGEIYTSQNGFSKLGKSTTLGYSGTVFEPNDVYKGDFARAYFYMATAYEDRISDWNSPMLAGNKYPAYAEWAIRMLLRWAEQDPVSEKEIARNNAVFQIQKNRNPYIDYPGLEQYVWGRMSSSTFDPDHYVQPGSDPQPGAVALPVFSPAPGAVKAGTVVTVSSATKGASLCYTLNGGNLKTDVETVGITVVSPTTIAAYAELNGERSPTVLATYTLQDESQEGGGVYALVDDETTLTADMQVLVVCGAKQVAMGAQNNDIRLYSEVETTADNTVYTKVNEPSLPYAFRLGGGPGAWTLYDSVLNAYVSLTADANKLHTSQTAVDAQAQWDIRIDNGGEALITNRYYPARAIKYNPSSPRFATYTSAQSAVSVYARVSTSDIDRITIGAHGGVTVYDVYGRWVSSATSAASALRQLPAGFYLVNGRKVLIR